MVLVYGFMAPGTGHEFIGSTSEGNGFGHFRYRFWHLWFYRLWPLISPGRFRAVPSFVCELRGSFTVFAGGTSRSYWFMLSGTLEVFRLLGMSDVVGFHLSVPWVPGSHGRFWPLTVGGSRYRFCPLMSSSVSYFRVPGK
jgi:hypothetical protein